jgi:hypothetical protein
MIVAFMGPLMTNVPDRYDEAKMQLPNLVPKESSCGKRQPTETLFFLIFSGGGDSGI